MIWQYSPYFIAFITCGVILSILAITGWLNRSHICTRSFTILMLATSLWSFCTALELASADLPTQMLAISIEYVGMVIIPVGWLLFTLEYTGREHWITRSNVALLMVIPVFTVVMVATNSWHHLYYTSVTEILHGGLLFHEVTYGPAFWLHSIYSYLLIGTAIVLLIQRFALSTAMYRDQMTIILIATLIPFLFNLAFVLRFGFSGFIDPSPFAFAIAGFLILFGMMRYQLLDITPVAQDLVIENMRDGVVVIDLQGRIVSLNAQAERITGRSRRDAIGTTIAVTLPCSAPFLETIVSEGGVDDKQHELERETGGIKQYFEIRCIPVYSQGSELRGRLVLIRDITEQKVAELGLLRAKKKLELLSGITRHDILNQATVLLLSIDSVKDTTKDPGVQEWLDRQESAVRIIQHQIEFARDYESLGGQAPQWMNINRIFSYLVPLMGVRGITFVSPEQDIEIFADPLLERVFYNLVDNSFRHGEHVTMISIRSTDSPGGITLIYEDNGVGVPVEAKQKIFERGFGKHTGLGLFLAQEILEITGLSSSETGIPGTGVRFEIQVPREQYRIRS
ncbi:histidine kinase N-terminal 7TM domain-containing protein [Methanoregula sp.]|uniref:histidine kinase N-terminal 7TM domain-containing protein n=1 Tax=Methanoregula sp. TaxID=2052170 RepID=UPI00237196C0|nr:histidine kinase N-terminal 7TM domain-containing protein [Methanoregula sp.]MDD1686352.1 PAS domain-containing protein [Methanoregula sp.]